jgi:hypothetical protein
MGKKQDKEVLDFGIGVDIRDALKAIEKYQRQMAKSMKAVADSGEQMGKATGKGAKKAKEETEALADAVGDVGKAYEEEAGAVSNLTKTIRELSVLAKNSTGDEKKALQAQIKALKKVDSERKKLGGGTASPPKGGLFFGRFTPEKVKKELAEAGEALKAPLEAFLAKDAKGLVAGSMKGAGAVLGRSLKVSRIFAGMASEALTKRGERASLKGKAAGGAGGMASQAGGMGMKAMGSMMGKLGSSLEFLTKLGPILGTLSGAVVGLVKLFLDADAMVKELNKDVMQSASNLEFLERAGWSSGAAIQNMSDALKGVRNAATDATFNNALGITKETHTAILNTLNQEGVALGNLSAEAGNTVEGMERLTKSIVSMGVGYSRALGVPLTEINQLQAEMMTEMANNVGATELAFTKMTRSAAASGIAGNKFFAIIRGASQDLSLWNLRLESAVDLLGKMGKILSPRGAQGFFQSITSGFKNMGRQDLLKQTLMAGVENVRGVLKTEVGEQQLELAKQIKDAGGAGADSVEDVLKVIQKEGYRGADRLIRTVKDVDKIGTLRQKSAEITRKSQGAAGGTYEVSQASREIRGTGGQIGIMMKAVERLGGSLLRPNEMALAAVAESQGMSQEMVEQLHGIAIAADAQKQILLDNAKAKGDTAEIAKINKMTWQQIIDSDQSLKSSSDKLQDDQIKAQESVQQAIERVSKEQGQQTMPIMAKLGNWVDWFMGVFYNVMLDIWDGIMSLVKWGGAQAREDKKDIYRSGDMDLIKAFDAAMASGKDGKLDFNSLKGSTAGGSFGGRLDKTLETEKGRASVASTVGSQISGTGVLEMGRTGGLSAEKMAALEAQLQRQTTRRVAGGGHHLASGTTTQTTSGIAKRGEVGDLLKIFKDIGLSAEEQANVLSKAGWVAPDVRAIIELTKSLNAGTGSAQAVPSAGPTATAPVVEAEKTNEQLGAIVTENRKLQGVVEQQGIRIAPETLKQEAQGMEASMLSALRTALFEYYLYSGTDRGTMLSAMSTGGVTDPRAMAAMFSGKSLETGSTLGAVDGLATRGLTANAGGGVVTGVSNGMALVAAQGEGLASVGRGERIVASGTGGANVSVTVNGIGGRDLANLIEGKVVEGIRDYKRREKFY